MLSKLAETANKALKIQEMQISQNRILTIAKRLSPDKTWDVIPVDLAKIKASAVASIAKGEITMDVMLE